MPYRFVCISIYIHCPRDASLVRGECFVMLQKLGNFGEQVCLGGWFYFMLRSQEISESGKKNGELLFLCSVGTLGL